MFDRRRVLSLALLCVLVAGPRAHAAWPVVITVFNDPNLPVESLGLTERGGEHWFVAEVWDDVTSTGSVYTKRHTPAAGLGARADIGVDPGGARRLVSGSHALPAIAIDSNTAAVVSMKVDAVGYGPTTENVAVNPVSLAVVQNPPALIDDNAALGADRGRSWIAINMAMNDVWSCWTYHASATNDDVYCRARPTGQANLTWVDPILALATDPNIIEDHPSVALQPSTSRRVVAYHTSTGIKVRLFDQSNVEDTPNDVALGGTSNVDFPHLIEANGVLHVVAVNTATRVLNYASCAANCHINANWTRETIDDTTAAGESVAHPQVAVDDEGHVFVAFQHTPAAGGATAERVKVTAKCAVDGWDNDGGELVDDTADREQVGGNGGAKGLPAFVYDATHNRLGVTYVQAAAAADRIGRWARKDAALAYSDICAGQP
jgi:hypothetical protein